MNRQVKYAKLHQSIFTPGCGNLTDTLESLRHGGIKMELSSDGLYVDYKGVSFIVPLANIACAVFSEPAPSAVTSLPAHARKTA